VLVLEIFLYEKHIYLSLIFVDFRQDETQADGLNMRLFFCTNDTFDAEISCATERDRETETKTERERERERERRRG